MTTTLFNSSEQYADDPAFEPPLTNLWRNHVDRWNEGEWDSDSSRHSRRQGKNIPLLARTVISTETGTIVIKQTSPKTQRNTEIHTNLEKLKPQKSRKPEIQGNTEKEKETAVTATTLDHPQDSFRSTPANGPVVTTSLFSSLRGSLTPGLPSQTAPGVSAGVPTTSVENSPTAKKASNRVAIIAPTVVGVLIGVIFLTFLTRYLILRRRQLRSSNTGPVTEDIIEAWDAGHYRRTVDRGRDMPYVQDLKRPQLVETDREDGVVTTHSGLAVSSSDVFSNSATHLYQTLKLLPDQSNNSAISSTGLGMSTSTGTTTANAEGVSSVIAAFLDSLSPEGREELMRTLASSEMASSSRWRSPYAWDRTPSFASQETAPPEYQG